jgi:hypothetical protein
MSISNWKNCEHPQILQGKLLLFLQDLTINTQQKMYMQKIKTVWWLNKEVNKIKKKIKIYRFMMLVY